MDLNEMNDEDFCIQVYNYFDGKLFVRICTIKQAKEKLIDIQNSIQADKDNKIKNPIPKIHKEIWFGSYDAAKKAHNENKTPEYWLNYKK